MSEDKTFKRLLDFIRKLEEVNLHFHLKSIRDESIAVLVFVPGEHWEVEFMDDGSIEVERFRSDGSIAGEDALDELFERFSD